MHKTLVYSERFHAGLDLYLSLSLVYLYAHIFCLTRAYSGGAGVKYGIVPLISTQLQYLQVKNGSAKKDPIHVKCE